MSTTIIMACGMLAAFVLGAAVRKPFSLPGIFCKKSAAAEKTAAFEQEAERKKICDQWANLFAYNGQSKGGDK